MADEQTVNFESLQLDSPEIPELCREKYRQLLGEWPAPGEMDNRAAVWAMAWLSKPDSSPSEQQIDAAVDAWFSSAAGDEPASFNERMCAAFAAAKEARHG